MLIFQFSYLASILGTRVQFQKLSVDIFQKYVMKMKLKIFRTVFLNFENQ